MLWIDCLCGQRGPVHPAPDDSAVHLFYVSLSKANTILQIGERIGDDFDRNEYTYMKSIIITFHFNHKPFKQTAQLYSLLFNGSNSIYSIT